MKKMMRVILILFTLTTISACANVKPWERGNLAKPHMAFSPENTHNTLRRHVGFSKEASGGGFGIGSGGCGCN